MADEVKILGIAGSLRKQSYNRAALQAAAKLVPAGITRLRRSIWLVSRFSIRIMSESHHPPCGSSSR